MERLMNIEDIKKFLHVLVVFYILFLFFIMIPVCASAEQVDLSCTTRYEFPDDSEYLFSKGKKVSKFTYGSSSLGTLCLSGKTVEPTAYNGTEAYGISNEIDICYTYNRYYHSDNKDIWHIVDDSGKTVNGIKTPKIEEGLILIQTSSNRLNWNTLNWNTVHSENDLFKKSNYGKKQVFQLTGNDTRDGVYCRVMVAYRMGKRTEDNFLFDEYLYKECLEIYEFYVCSNDQNVQILSLSERKEIKKDDEISDGFYISKNGSKNEVKIKKDNDEYVTAKEFQVYNNPGNYEVKIKTLLGKEYHYSITVTDGMNFEYLLPSVYKCEKNTGFEDRTTKVTYLTSRQNSLTKLSLGIALEASVTENTKNGMPAYGITGDKIELYLKIDANCDNLGGGWAVCYDKWGKKEKQTVSGVTTGEIGKGALIVQTSTDGKNWSNRTDKGKYANGLYTTDYAEHYETGERVCIYTPNGESVLKGTYLRVLYAYQLYNKEEKEYVDYLEEYKFYLCSSDLGAVTFHNLTLSQENTEKDYFGDYDENTRELCKLSETLKSGTCTVTGFTVDTSLNPTVSYTVERNGEKIKSKEKEYTEPGKYTVLLTSAVGDKFSATVYVDNASDEEAMARYFSDGFITGKRIYSENLYRVYEGGHCEYRLNPVFEEYLPLTGKIVNCTTGTEILIEDSRNGCEGTLTEAGEYRAEFITLPEYDGEEESGDFRKFTFYFSVIEEGTAPGPVVNKKSLETYAHSSVTDCYPIYYGVTYTSASKGQITLAFATEEDARKNAYEYNSGTVETSEDGTYRYQDASQVARKEKYTSAWDLTDDINNSADKAADRMYFNLSDRFSYQTLPPELQDSMEESDLRALKLTDSVVIFADGQKEKLMGIQTMTLPVINDKPYSYLDIESGKIESGTNHFEFVGDQYGGIDSSHVVITDSMENNYVVEYKKSVGQQLEEQDCPSSIITITESTVYGDTTTYQAVYFAPGENTAELQISCYDGSGTEEKRTINQTANGQTITTGAFKISEMKDLLDPYSLVIIKNEGQEVFYTVQDETNKVWSKPGKYEFECVNRLGHQFAFVINIVESENTVIKFFGTGTEEIPDIITALGSENITLPIPTRYGYHFAGFADDDNNTIVYKDTIPNVNFSGEKNLTAIWEPVQVVISLTDEEGKLINTVNASYGEQVLLPQYIPQTSGEFAGWTYNGTILKGNSFTVETEDDVVLMASVNKVELPEESTAGPIENIVETAEQAWQFLLNHRTMLIVAGAAVFVVLMIIVIASNTGRKKKKEGKDR